MNFSLSFSLPVTGQAEATEAGHILRQTGERQRGPGAESAVCNRCGSTRGQTCMWVVKVKRCDASATRALPERLIDESLTITRSTIALSLRRRYDREAQYCDECVCVFVCPRLYLRNYTSDLQQIFAHVTYGRGSVGPPLVA